MAAHDDRVRRELLFVDDGGVRQRLSPAKNRHLSSGFNIRSAAVPVDTLRRSFRLAMTALRPLPRIGIATSM